MDVDEGRRESDSKDAGIYLLPTDLTHNIFLRLPVPEIPQLRSVSISFKTLTSDPSFLHHYNSKSRNAPWLFAYTKKWGHDAVLKGITIGLDRWVSFPIKELLAPIDIYIDDLYFLTARGGIFLFIVNTTKELVSVNLNTKLAIKIPPSPVCPRYVSSWRWSGMKLILGSGGSDHFRLFFLNYFQNKISLFEYDSLSGNWQVTDVQETATPYNLTNTDESTPNGYIFLHVRNSQGKNITVSIWPEKNYMPLIIESHGCVHSIFDLIVSDRMRIYGDGTMMKVQFTNVSAHHNRKKTTVRVELWGCLSSNGVDKHHWEMISEVPKEFLRRQPEMHYGSIRGCLERKNGVIRVVLMSNNEGFWDIIWLSYEMEKREWRWTLLPDRQMRGFNMSGIALSSGLTLF